MDTQDISSIGINTKNIDTFSLHVLKHCLILWFDFKNEKQNWLSKVVKLIIYDFVWHYYIHVYKRVFIIRILMKLNKTITVNNVNITKFTICAKKLNIML